MRNAALRSLAVAFLPLFFACRAEQPTPQRPVATSSATTSPRAGWHLARRLESDINTLNYVMQTTDYERNLLAYIYDPLIDLDADLKPIPAAASKWDIAADHKTYTFHLDPSATFSDGTPVTANDVVFTLKKIVEEQSPQFLSWFDNLDLKQTVATDDHTVKVVFSEPRVSQIYSFNIGVLPEHVYSKGDFKKDFNTAVPVGNGPYKLTTRDAGKSYVLTKRDDYRGTKPYIDSVTFKVLTDDTTAWNAIRRGEVDETRVTNDRWFAEKDRPEAKSLQFVSVYPLSYDCIAWRLSDPMFRDVKVRRAMAMAFDRQSIIDHVYHGQARPVTGPYTADVWAADPTVQAPPFDLNGARALLEQAGWKDSNKDGTLDRGGQPFEFELLVPAGNTIAVTQAQTFQAALEKIGVKMRIRSMDGAAFFDSVMRGKYQAAFLGWSTDPDPDVFALFHSSQKPPAGLNVVDYSNPEVDRLLEDGRREFDPAKRAEMYHRVHQILANDQPYLWTLQAAWKYALTKRVHGVNVSKGFGLYLWRPGPLGWWLTEP